MIEASWRPLEIDFAECVLNGSENLVAAKVLGNATDTWGKLLAADWSFTSQLTDCLPYLRYLERQIMLQALALAKKPSYDKCKGSVRAALGRNTLGLIELTISQKTAELVRIFRDAISLTEGHVRSSNMRQILGSVATAYLHSFGHIFAVQLSQIPHLTALLYNDCQFLAILLINELPADQDGESQAQGVEIQVIGAKALQSLLVKQLAEIGDYCVPKRFSSRSGSIDYSFLETVDRSLTQATARISQLIRVLSSVLDIDLTYELAELLVFSVLDWLWSGILSIESIKQDAVGRLSEVAGKTVSFASTLIPPLSLHNYPLVSRLVRKLESLMRMTSMNLLQLSNAFRRSDLIDILTLGEFRHVILFLFPETAMKKAFLAEIDAEM